MLSLNASGSFTEEVSTTRGSARERLGRRFLSTSQEAEASFQEQNYPSLPAAPQQNYQRQHTPGQSHHQQNMQDIFPQRRFRSRSRSPSPNTLARKARNRELGELFPTPRQGSGTETSRNRNQRNHGRNQKSSLIQTTQCRRQRRN